MSLRVFYRVNEEPEREGHSFTRNWLQALRSVLGARQVTMVDTGGVSRTVGFSGTKYLLEFFNMAAGMWDPYGIIPGSSNTPSTYEDTALGAVISHGVAQGIYYYTQGQERDGASGYYWSKRSRTFYNFTGTPLVVREFGIVVQMPDIGGTNRRFLVFHEVIPDTIVGAGSLHFPTVPGQTLTIGLTLRVFA